MAKKAMVAYENPRTDKREAAYVGKVRRSLDDMGAPNSGELVHNSGAYLTGVYHAGIDPQVAASVIWHQHCEKPGSSTTPCVAECPVPAASESQKLMPGYAYVGYGKDYKKIKNDFWEIRMVSAHGGETAVGRRMIDGELVQVWRAGPPLTDPPKFYAQVARGEASESGAACPGDPTAMGAACPPVPPSPSGAAYPVPLKVRGYELVITTFDGFQLKVPSSHLKEKADQEAAFITGRGVIQFGNCPVRVSSVEVKATSEFLEANDSAPGTAEVPVAKIVRDEAVIEAVRTEAPEPLEDDREVFELLSERMGPESQEIFVVLCLDLNRQLTSYVEVARGQRDRVNVDVSDVMRAVILSNCHGFIVAHNHPSGQATPSDKDRELTERIKIAAAPYSSVFLDHIVVGKDEWYSFTDGKLKKA